MPQSSSLTLLSLSRRHCVRGESTQQIPSVSCHWLRPPRRALHPRTPPRAPESLFSSPKSPAPASTVPLCFCEVMLRTSHESDTGPSSGSCVPPLSTTSCGSICAVRVMESLLAPGWVTSHRTDRPRFPCGPTGAHEISRSWLPGTGRQWTWGAGVSARCSFPFLWLCTQKWDGWVPGCFYVLLFRDPPCCFAVWLHPFSLPGTQRAPFPPLWPAACCRLSSC